MVTVSSSTPARQGQFGAAVVGHQGGEGQRLADNAPQRSRPATTSAAPAMAGTARGDTKAATSTRRAPAPHQRLDQAHPVGDGNGRLGLQPVAGPDLADRPTRDARP